MARSDTANLKASRMLVEVSKLERFIYISTECSNTHLWKLTGATDVPVQEDIYPLGQETDLGSKHSKHGLRCKQRGLAMNTSPIIFPLHMHTANI